MNSKEVGHGMCQEKTWAPQAAQLLGACLFDAAAPVRPCFVVWVRDKATILMNIELKGVTVD